MAILWPILCPALECMSRGGGCACSAPRGRQPPTPVDQLWVGRARRWGGCGGPAGVTFCDRAPAAMRLDGQQERAPTHARSTTRPAPASPSGCAIGFAAAWALGGKTREELAACGRAPTSRSAPRPRSSRSSRTRSSSLANAFKALSAEALDSTSQTLPELATAKLAKFQEGAQRRSRGAAESRRLARAAYSRVADEGRRQARRDRAHAQSTRTRR